MSTLIRASTFDCLQDFGRKVDLIQGISLLAEFTKVIPETALGWFQLGGDGKIISRKGLPKGGTLVRLRCFLELVGYKVEELQELTEPAAKLAWSVALDVVTVEAALERLDYAENNSQAILGQLLKPVSGLSAERIRKLRVLAEECEEDCRTAREAWQLRVQGMGSKEPAKATPSMVTSSSADVEQPPPVAGVILAGSFQIAALVLQQLQGVEPSVRATILEMVSSMVGTENLKTIGQWANGAI